MDGGSGKLRRRGRYDAQQQVGGFCCRDWAVGCLRGVGAAAAPTSTQRAYTIVGFANGSSSLSERSKENLAKLLANPPPWLKTVLVPNSSRGICIIGNADNTGSEAANVRLSQRRAEETADYLVELGIPREKIFTRGLGSSKPLVRTPPNTAEAQNRLAFVHFSEELCVKKGE